MVYNVYEGLGEEYKDYDVAMPQDLDYRPASEGAEQEALSSLIKNMKGDSRVIFIVGAVLSVIGIAVSFKQLGGIVLVLFGLVVVGVGFAKISKAKKVELVATGTLLKKDKITQNTRKHRTTHYWIVLEIDGVAKTLCPAHASAEDFDEMFPGDRVLIIDNPGGYYGKKVG